MLIHPRLHVPGFYAGWLLSPILDAGDSQIIYSTNAIDCHDTGVVFSLVTALNPVYPWCCRYIPHPDPGWLSARYTSPHFSKPIRMVSLRAVFARLDRRCLLVECATELW